MSPNVASFLHPLCMCPGKLMCILAVESLGYIRKDRHLHFQVCHLQDPLQRDLPGFTSTLCRYAILNFISNLDINIKQ